MFPSVSCFVSPRNGDAPLKLKGQHARSLFVISSGALRFQLIIQSQYNSQYICDDADAPVKEQHKVNPKLCQAAWCTAGITKALTTCPPPIPAAHSWLSLELKIDSTHCCITRSQTQSPLFTLKLIKKKKHLPTNSGVPKMFLNSAPASILCARPKSMSLMRGRRTFLSRSIIFSGWNAKGDTAESSADCLRATRLGDA